MPFQKGQSGNPAGRKRGSRNKLKDEFLRLIIEDVKAHGKAVLADVRKKFPETYLTLVASLLPKEVNVRSDHTVTHKSEDVSETSTWIAGTLATGSDSEAEKPLPN